MSDQPGGGRRPNVLFVTLDQFRADHLAAAGHRTVTTPTLDGLAARGVRFARHFSQAAPCGPGRAALYTGTYQFNNRVVANGTPLDRRFDNVFLAAARAGYSPVVFGYTDQSIDPRTATGPDDVRLSNYSPGDLPGAELLLGLPDDHRGWVEWLGELGYETSGGADELLATEHLRPDHHSVSAFLTDHAIEWVRRQTAPWFAHLSYLRPHPPFSAAGDWAQRYLDPDADLGTPIALAADVNEFHQLALDVELVRAPTDVAELRRLRAHYCGMISHVDHELERVLACLDELGCIDDTVVVVSSDHGELLGDHGLLGKLGYWEQSFAIPCIVSDPGRPEAHGTVVEHFTENVDVMPTVCALIGAPIPAQCDGRDLTPFLDGDEPDSWRTGAHWEFDWRDLAIAGAGKVAAPEWDRRLAVHHLAALRTATHLFVQFATGRSLCFDLVADPDASTPIDDPLVAYELATQMLAWRAEHADRTLSDVLCAGGGIGRWPPVAAARIGDC